METRKLPRGFEVRTLADFNTVEDSSRYEVSAPEGFHFLGGEHARLCNTLREARQIAREPLAPCPDDCDCKA
jgi:hypothetical protein